MLTLSELFNFTMDLQENSFEFPTNIQRWQLPRRFDAVTWFVRLQRENKKLLNHFRVIIPSSGASLLEVRDGELSISQQLGSTGEVLLDTSILPWHEHAIYLESLNSWSLEHSSVWLASASITWLLSLHREAWLAIARRTLMQEDTTWFVRSAWLCLALGSSDHDLLGLVDDSCYNSLHAQVYADETHQALLWLELHKPDELIPWLNVLSKRLFFKPIWGRLPTSQRSRISRLLPPHFSEGIL